jgi:hypothetical protein
MVLRYIIFSCFVFLLSESCSDYSVKDNPDLVIRKPQETAVTDSASILKKRTSEIYIKGVAEYLKASFEKHKFSPDTIFIGKLPEDPDIDLPATIEKVPVKFITIEEATEKMKQAKSWNNINIASWINTRSAEFIIVTFLDGGKPQHNCKVFLSERPGKKEFELDSLRFEYPYKKQYHDQKQKK